MSAAPRQRSRAQPARALPVPAPPDCVYLCGKRQSFLHGACYPSPMISHALPFKSLSLGPIKRRARSHCDAVKLRQDRTAIGIRRFLKSFNTFSSSLSGDFFQP